LAQWPAANTQPGNGGSFAVPVIPPRNGEPHGRT
jgi:hypothetical protein